MLRRFTPHGVERFDIGSNTVVGYKNCDITLKEPGVHAVHCSIELHPISRTFWLKDLSLTGTTTVNGKALNGQIELHNGDLIQFGQAHPMVFQQQSVPNKTDVHHRNRLCEESVDGIMLPVLGRQLTPGTSSGRVLAGSQYRQPTAHTRRKRSIRRPQRANTVSETFGQNDNRSIDLSSEESVRASTGDVAHRNGSAGHNLLQRVIRLQAEVARKDDEILSLNHRVAQIENNRSGILFARRVSSPNYAPIEELPRRVSRAASISRHQNFELDVYRCFLSAVTCRLRSFNERVLSTPQKDYSDIFNNFCRALDEPFAMQLLDIESDCENALEKLGYDVIQRSRLRTFIEDDRKEQIACLAKELDTVFPVLRDASVIARDSIRHCTVFTQWSRLFGDTLRTAGVSSENVLHGIDQLKEHFSQANMSRHWLPPSLVPLLRLIALDTQRKKEQHEKSLQTDWTNTEIEEHLAAGANLSRIIEDLEFEKNELRATLDEHLSRHRVSLVEVGPAEDERSTDARSMENGQGQLDLQDVLRDAELKTETLKRQLEELGYCIEQAVELDVETEQRLNELLSNVSSVDTPLRRLRTSEIRKHSGESIVSVEVSEKDIEEGLKQLSAEESFQLEAYSSDEELESDVVDSRQRRSRLKEGTERISIIHEGSEENTDHENRPDGFPEEIEDVKEVERNEDQKIVFPESTMEREENADNNPDTHFTAEQNETNIEKDSFEHAQETEEVETSAQVSHTNEENGNETNTRDAISDREHKESERGEEDTDSHQEGIAIQDESEIGGPTLEVHDIDGHEVPPNSEQAEVLHDEAVYEGNNDNLADDDPSTELEQPDVVQDEGGPAPSETAIHDEQSPSHTFTQDATEPNSVEGDKIIVPDNSINDVTTEDRPPSIDQKSLPESSTIDGQLNEETDINQQLALTVRGEKQKKPPTTKKLASFLLDGEKPKSICEISHSAHIQSHINTATRVPIVHTSFLKHTYKSPPMKRRAKSEEVRLRQPRMLF